MCVCRSCPWKGEGTYKRSFAQCIYMQHLGEGDGFNITEYGSICNTFNNTHLTHRKMGRISIIHSCLATSVFGMIFHTVRDANRRVPLDHIDHWILHAHSIGQSRNVALPPTMDTALSVAQASGLLPAENGIVSYRRKCVCVLVAGTQAGTQCE